MNRAVFVLVLAVAMPAMAQDGTPPKPDELVTAWMQSVVLSSQIRDAKAKVLQALPEYKEYEKAQKDFADLRAATDKKIAAKHPGFVLDWTKGVLVPAPQTQAAK